MTQDLRHLVAYKLCPYVQRSVITLKEKAIPYKRTDIELADKPQWFKTLSPTGKVPVLIISAKNESQTVLFESAVICEFLDETTPGKLLPPQPIERAHHRAWIEFSTNLLNQISKFYSATSQQEFEQVQSTLTQQFVQLNSELNKNNPDITNCLHLRYFNGSSFSLVDAAFAPVFRYFDAFQSYVDIPCFQGLDSINSWRKHLANRPSVKNAVSLDYQYALVEFVKKKQSYLGKKMT